VPGRLQFTPDANTTCFFSSARASYDPSFFSDPKCRPMSPLARGAPPHLQYLFDDVFAPPPTRRL
jgi:hypothetical protein